ncbi:hypothetical protein [Clostridium grantii]|uniref:hypothetical protein n=1 Tax=Clostridium grantii TaxID=40575 RepID=UPI001FA8C464|nr:hypothetical protein [Clostridium grantii]
MKNPLRINPLKRNSSTTGPRITAAKKYCNELLSTLDKSLNSSRYTPVSGKIIKDIVLISVITINNPIIVIIDGIIYFKDTNCRENNSLKVIVFFNLNHKTIILKAVA